MTYLILNPNGKPIAGTLRAWPLDFVEIRESAGPPGTIVLADMSDWRALERVAARVHFERPLRGVVSCHESSMLAAAYLRAALALPGPTFDQTVPFINKHQMKHRVVAAGVRTPAHELLRRNLVEQLRAPVVVKPVAGASCIGTRLYSPAEARAALDAPPDGLRLVEEAASVVSEYHVDSVYERGEPRWVEASRYSRPPLAARDGTGIGSVLLDADEPVRRTLLELNARVLAAMPLQEGVFHAEFLELAGGELLFGEIAARPGGGGICAAVRHACDVDLMAEHLRLSLQPADRPATSAARARSALGKTRIGWLVLPVGSGRVRSLTPRSELTARASVVAIEQHVQVGELVSGEAHPYRGAYTLVLSLPSPRAFPAECEEILSNYHCELA